jgi:prepilin-type N-terminal cleavage/methylation domain-containing protein
VERKRSGLTLVEILVVVVIIAMLTGMLIPAVSSVKKMAREAKQRAQFTAIELGLEAFKNDFGDYPPSDPNGKWNGNIGVADSAGALKLAEAMLGWDMLGVHPNTDWCVNGYNRSGSFIYDGTSSTELAKRKGRYVEMGVANPFKLGTVFDLSSTVTGQALYDDQDVRRCYFLGDVFGKGASVVLNPNDPPVRSGRPILYFRANTAAKFIDGQSADSTYVLSDNYGLLRIIEGNDRLPSHLGTPTTANWNLLANSSGTRFAGFSDYLTDSRIAPTKDYKYVSYRPDSYILISAGADGLYGTSDDVCNFGK